MTTSMAARPDLLRVAFVGVGQTPRLDVVPEILAQLDLPIAATEFGALDGLTDAEIAELAPRVDEHALVTRLADGTDVVISKPRVGERLARILAGFAPSDFDLVVILSTGLFREFESRCLTVNAQRAMESGVLALAAHGGVIGLVQPLAQQVAEVNVTALSPYRIVLSHAAPGDRDALAHALIDLAESEIIVLNSVGFNEADRAMVARASGKPVVLARRIVAGAMRLLLDGRRDLHRSYETAPILAERLQRLTPRERQVLSLAAEGLSNKAIGRQLGISPKTVEIHRSKVMSKMEVASTGALIRLVVSAEHPEL
ncbi:AroM family protein [Microvirga brassicacearum]|uniref:LuxR family transcriptional regulator n=1 Tax=Microvirga brassicacearum TaxID=2580413 RepID=A0A5N3P8T2_9HYPH|nr:AroM family protein [Microvirga brassicacearum]KAB0266144.1 LuxR family transcriptional regulator [Microvirga brassicacearum]